MMVKGMQRTLLKQKGLKSKATRFAKKRSRPRRSVIPPGQVDSPDRRRAILLAAAELFSVHGYNAVSIRDIAKRANVPATLCGYYFGRKSELFASVFLHSPDHIEKRRAALQAFATDGSLEDMIRLWIEPVVQMRSNADEAPFAVLSARASWDSSAEAKAAVKRFYNPIAFAVLRALKRLLPERDPNDLAWGYEWALGAFLMHLGSDRIESLSEGRTGTDDLGSKTDALMRFVCAGFRSLPSNGGEPRNKSWASAEGDRQTNE
jgi:AcrR family transcriptional regulator